jgi:glycosyltransferase involved in cell wall biosynthesis
VPLAGRDIVCLSTHYFDERRFRKQEFMDRFRRRNRVLYVEPSYSMLRAPEPHLTHVAQNQLCRSRLTPRGDNLWTLQPPRQLPYWSRPAVGPANFAWFALAIRRQMRALSFRDPVLWVYQPAYAPAIRLLPHHDLVFDLVDDLAGYMGDDGPMVAATEARVRSLVERCDLLVVTSPPLLDRYGSVARRSVLVPNGYDASTFAPWPQDAAAPPELAGLDVPILGLVGTLFSFLDYELLLEVARRNRDKALVLLGPIEESSRPDVERLVAEPNVRHVPSVPREAVPSYVRHFSVCLNAFKVGRVADNVSPLKVYEYLALGKPVVSTPMAGLQREEVARAISFASTVEAYCRCIDESLAAGPEAAAERRLLVESHSWERLFDRLDAECSAVL